MSSSFRYGVRSRQSRTNSQHCFDEQIRFFERKNLIDWPFRFQTNRRGQFQNRQWHSRLHPTRIRIQKSTPPRNCQESLPVSIRCGKRRQCRSRVHRSVIDGGESLSMEWMIWARENRFSSIEMCTEVIQDSIFDLWDSDKLRFASTTALTFSPKRQTRFFDELTELESKFVLRPMEISNNPEVIRRMSLITMNTALEADIYGNDHSTHVLGSSMINGIGGRGDFTRNAVRNVFIPDQCRMIRLVHLDLHGAVDCQRWENLRVRSHGVARRSQRTFSSNHGRWTRPRRSACEESEGTRAIDPWQMRSPDVQRSTEWLLSFAQHIPHDLRQALSWHMWLQETGSMHPDH